MFSTLFILVAALLLDRLFGETKRFHPLVGFGWLASRYEKKTNTQQTPRRHFAMGLCGLILLGGGIATLLSLVYFTPYALVFETIILYIAIAPRSLREHALNVQQALQQDDLARARQQVSYMVSRHIQQMDEQQISRAAIESTLENGNDAIFGALFWFLIAGIPGVVLYRLTNTLDAMWGYRTERYEQFGKAAALFDDFLNYIPARLTAVSYALCGHFSNAIRCWKAQAKHLSSPNGGPVMCAGAGALQCQLGGKVIYHGIPTERPLFGCGKPPNQHDIQQAVNLIQRSLYLWLVVITISVIIGYLTHA